MTSDIIDYKRVDARNKDGISCSPDPPRIESGKILIIVTEYVI